MYANPAYEEVEVEQESLEARLTAAEHTTARLETELQQALQGSISLEEVSTRQALDMPAVCPENPLFAVYVEKMLSMMLLCRCFMLTIAHAFGC